MKLEKVVRNKFPNTTFVESYEVTQGVNCDTYKFDNDSSKDLAIVTIRPGCKTPRQKIVRGEKTIEGILTGSGKLTTQRQNGEKETFENYIEPIEVKVGEIMQWQASKDGSLVIYEICYPPYKEGRFKNIDE